MTGDPGPHDVAAALRGSIGLLLRQMRQVRVAGELTVPETSALARLDRGGPATPSALAKLEQISPQSMGATLGALEARCRATSRPGGRQAGGHLGNRSRDGGAAEPTQRADRDPGTGPLDRLHALGA